MNSVLRSISRVLRFLNVRTQDTPVLTSIIRYHHHHLYRVSAVTTYGTNRQLLNYIRVKQQSRRRTISTSSFKVTTAATQTLKLDSMELVEDVLKPKSGCIIRFHPDDERFEMQVTTHNGKVFNFSRSTSETVSNVVTRMLTNISKKLKNFNGTLQFLSNDSVVNALIKDDAAIKSILMHGIQMSSLKLKVQIGDDVYEIAFNPPEVFAIKYFNICIPTLPVFPCKIETTDNFSKEKSLYIWEFSREKPSSVVPPKLKTKNLKNQTSAHNGSSSWTVCGNGFYFTPEKGMEGGYLRFTVIPSTGSDSTLGKPFTVVLSQPIIPLTVETFLFQERLSRLANKSNEEGSLRVMSYNILADTYATPEWFISSPKESLEPGYRFPILNLEIPSYQADLVCLQEVDEKYFDQIFLPYLSSSSVGYHGFHTSKTNNTKEGIATFYDPSKLNLLASHECVILEHMKTLWLWERLKSVGGDFIQRLEDRNTVFHVSVFKLSNVSSNTILAVGNVHLYFHPDADHIRLLQTITCISFLESKLALIKTEYPDYKVAVIFCGDLNCTPPFSSYRLLTSGKVDESDDDWTSHSEEKIDPGITFSHSLNLANSHPGEELTNITTCFEGCLDYILYQSEHITLCRTCPPPSKDKLADLTNVGDPRKVSLPNFYTPSDHLPLIADFKFKI